MSNTKYKLTSESISVFGKTLFRIEALTSFDDVKAGDRGGYIEKEENLSIDGDARVYGNARVYGDAWVSGNARVYGDAWVSAKLAYKRGRFVGGDDSDKPTFAEVTDKMGNDFWRHQYVIGDYEITEIDEKPEEVPSPEVIELNGKKYQLIED